MGHRPSPGGDGPLARAESIAELGRGDPATAAHMQRTGAAAGAIAAILGLAPHAVEAIRCAAAFHDVGKAAIPPRILEKPGALTPAERTEVERHPLIGHRMLIGAGGPGRLPAARIALLHHERFDGGGYPHGLAGEEIPLAGRIVAVADVLDALLSDRPYRPALPRAQALDLLASESGGHFDPAVVGPAIDQAEDLIA
jgi:HD-GYP domain-containing protein (c-di-GMP phosphodiesterase class II)